MEYEHERWISNLIEYKLFTEGFDPKEETRAIDELKDVYAKAKAFNEIKERIYYEKLAWTDEGYYDGYHERIGNITEDVIDKYDNQMEDK